MCLAMLQVNPSYFVYQSSLMSGVYSYWSLTHVGIEFYLNQSYNNYPEYQSSLLSGGATKFV